MRCPECAAEVRETAKVCGFCGTRLQSLAPVAVEPPADSVPSDAIEVGEAAVVASLGVAEEPIDGSVGPDVDDGKPRRRPPVWIWVVVTVLVIGAGVWLGISLVGGDDTAPPGDLEAVVGSWRGVDSDGSSHWYFIDPSGEPGRVEVTYYDARASACSGGRAAAIMETFGTYDSDTQALVLDRRSAVCLFESGPESLPAYEVRLKLAPGASGDRLLEEDSMNEFLPAPDADRGQIVGR